MSRYIEAEHYGGAKSNKKLYLFQIREGIGSAEVVARDMWLPVQEGASGELLLAG
jgi:hypothetical protein